MLVKPAACRVVIASPPGPRTTSMPSSVYPLMSVTT